MIPAREHPARRQLEEAIASAHALADALDEARMNARPDPVKWSVAQNLDHLTITARRMMKTMESAVDELRAGNQRSTKPYSPGLTARTFLWVLEPPVRALKVKAPAEFQAAAGRAAHLVRGEFFNAHEELLQRWEEFTAWDQNAALVVSPFDASGRVKYSLGLSLLIIPAHMRRHLWQAEQVLERLS
jgi:hypothetical protein